jgi:hypothetical protein
MCIGGVDHVKVSPDERAVWRCEWSLWVLALFQDFMTSVQVIARTSSTTERKTQESCSNQNHTRGGSLFHRVQPGDEGSLYLCPLEPALSITCWY